MASIKIASNHAASQVIFHILWNAKRLLAAATHYAPVESSLHSADQFVWNSFQCNFREFATNPVLSERAGISPSELWLATGWTVRGSNPGGGEIFRTRPDRTWDLPSLL